MPNARPSAGAGPRRGFAIRPFAEEDAPALLALMRALAAFEDYLDDFQVSAADLVLHGLGDTPRFGAFVAQAAETGELVGMAAHYPIPWAYDMRPTLVL